MRGIREPLVAGVAGHHDASSPRGLGDGAGAGAVAAALGVDKTVLLVAELGEHPGHRAPLPGRVAGNDLSVGVLSKAPAPCFSRTATCSTIVLITVTSDRTEAP